MRVDVVEEAPVILVLPDGLLLRVVAEVVAELHQKPRRAEQLRLLLVLIDEQRRSILVRILYTNIHVQYTVQSFSNTVYTVQVFRIAYTVECREYEYHLLRGDGKFTEQKTVLYTVQ